MPIRINYFWLIVFGGALIIVTAGSYFYPKPWTDSLIEKLPVIWLPEPKLLPDQISLKTTNGVSISRQDFERHWSLVFFGFTNCPDFCPMALQKLSGIVKKPLLKDSSFQIMFVSVDPERDSSDHIKDYLAFFNNAIIGLVGDNKSIASFSGFFNAQYERGFDSNGAYVPVKAGSDMPRVSNNLYYVSHSTKIFIIAPDGRYVGQIDSTLSAGKIYEGLAKLL